MIVLDPPTPNRWPGGLTNFRYRVDHTTEGGFSGALSWLTNPASQVSANYLVSKEGRIVQLCPLRDAAWHAGLTWAPSTPLFDGVNPNVESVGVEFEGTYAEPLTPAQLDASAQIDDAIKAEFKVATVPHVAHYELATGGPNFRRDPGVGNFAAILMRGAGMPFTDAQIAWLDDFVKRTIRVMLTSEEGAGLVEFAIRQPTGYAPKLQAWLDAHMALKGLAGGRRGLEPDPFAPLPAPHDSPSQKGTWPGPGPEPQAPEKGG